MGMPQDELPRYATCTPEEAAYYDELTRNGYYDLFPSEGLWRDRQPSLLSQGYLLRPRYCPGWTPSWLGTLRRPEFCEDSISSVTVLHVLDATRQSDGSRVTVKIASKDTQEASIGHSLNTHMLVEDPTNHCAPIFDVLPDPTNPANMLLILPYLTPFKEPQFTAIGEVVDFIRQTLEGIDFMHRQGVAHRDCTAGSIMMDSRPLYPRGHHPARRDWTMDAVHEAPCLSRIKNPVKYYLVDFDSSTRFAEDQLPLVAGAKGRDRTAPEFKVDEPYDAYKLDMYTLGHLYHVEFIEIYEGLDFLRPLIDAMVHEEPAYRPTSTRALEHFDSIVAEADFSPSSLRWRLASRSESTPVRIFWDTVAMVKEGVLQVRRLVGL